MDKETLKTANGLSEKINSLTGRIKNLKDIKSISQQEGRVTNNAISIINNISAVVYDYKLDKTQYDMIMNLCDSLIEFDEKALEKLKVEFKNL